MEEIEMRLARGTFAVVFGTNSGTDARSPSARVFPVGHDDGRPCGQMLAVPVKKKCDERYRGHAGGFVVAGIRPRSHGLTVELMNGAHSEFASEETASFLGGIAFERFTNSYVEGSATLHYGP